jgi:NitT/TauT family transport system substrate-binding protein
VPSDRLPTDLLRDGTVDILQTGVSRTLMALDEGHQDVPLHVAAINQRDGFFLVSRRPVAGWRWTDLEGTSLIPVGFTPVPWSSLRLALRRQGVDQEKVRLVREPTADGAMERFRQGGADYIHLPNPQAQQLVEEGAGHVAVAVGPVVGPVCYSSLAVAPAYLEASADVLHQFLRGLHRAQRWLAAGETAEVAGTIGPFFPDVSEAVLSRSVELYREQGTWAADPRIDEAGYVAMRDLLMQGGLVTGHYAYDRVVRPEFAERAVEEWGTATDTRGDRDDA